VNAFTAKDRKVCQDFTASKATDLVDRSPSRKAELKGSAVLAGVTMTRQPFPKSPLPRVRDARRRLGTQESTLLDRTSDEQKRYE